MREWIEGLVKAATDRRPGVSPEELVRLEGELGFTLPEDLKELYGAMDGADLPGEVTLYGLRAAADATGVLEQTLAALSGLPMRGIVRFGLRGGGEHLFAATRAELEPFTAGLAAPTWLAEVPMDFWIYGVKNADSGTLRLFRGLEQLVAGLVPATEGFGENTFVRALNAVQDTLGEVQQQLPLGTGAGVAPTEKRGAKRAPARKAATSAPAVKKPGAAKKKPAAAKRGGAKKAPAKAASAAKKTAAKRAPAKKGATRRVPAKRPAARKTAGKKANARPSAKRGAAKKRR